MCDIGIILSSFGDTGIQAKAQNNSIPLRQEEFGIVMNYYASVLSYTADKSLIGPLPVAYHPELLIFIYNFQVKDRSVKDNRVKNNGYKTPGFVFFVVPTNYDDCFTYKKKEILDECYLWTQEFSDVAEVDKKGIQKLEQSIITHITPAVNHQVLEDDYSREGKLLIRQIRLLSRVVVDSYNIHVLSNEPLYNTTIKRLLFRYGWDSVSHYTGNNGSFQLAMDKVGLWGSHLKDFKMGGSKGSQSFILFLDMDENHIRMFERIIESLERNELCLMVYTDRTRPFDQSPYAHILTTKGMGKNISLVEATGSQKVLESVNTFFYQLIEKNNVRKT